jgi:hypothetical protein
MANVFMVKFIYWQMSSGQMYLWANEFMGKCCLSKCHHGQIFGMARSNPVISAWQGRRGQNHQIQHGLNVLCSKPSYSA